MGTEVALKTVESFRCFLSMGAEVVLKIIESFRCLLLMCIQLQTENIHPIIYIESQVATQVRVQSIDSIV